MKVPWSLRRDVSEETLETIAKAVDEAEAKTSGEVHVHIVHTLGPLEKPRERAVKSFGRLGMQRTKKRNGVLLFVVMKNRVFEIVADEGLDEKVDRETWSEVAKLIEERIGRDGFAEGIAGGVARIGELLAAHFPREEDDINELPNRPSVG